MSDLKALMAGYKRTYLSFLRALTQSHLISIVAAHSLQDFPHKLPAELTLAATDLWLQVKELGNSAVAKLSEQQRENAVGLIDIDSLSASKTNRVAKLKSSDPDVTAFSFAFLEMIFATDIGSNSSAPKQDLGKRFRLLARQQALAMIFAHLDAFFSDTLRVACCARPEILRTNKQVTWATVLQFSSMDAFVDSIAEQFVYEFGWKTIADKIQSFDERMGVKVATPADELKFVSMCEQRRHLVIHNGGIITQRYVEQSGDATAAVGSAIEVSDADLRRLLNSAKWIGSDLCRSVAKKVLGADDQDLTQVWVHTALSEAS